MSDKGITRGVSYTVLALAVTLLVTMWVVTADSKEAHDQDKQPAEQEKTAGQVYKNLKFFMNMPASGLMASMTFMQNSLGVKCDHCHIPDQWDKDDKQTKHSARRMLVMVHELRRDFFKGARAVNCYSCHMGQPHPLSKPPQERSSRKRQPIKDGKKRAEQVFKNIDIFKGASAAQLMEAMDAFNVALGVDCTYCHTQDQWEKEDKPTKRTAREMFHLTEKINKEYVSGIGQVNCYTCHKGQVRPVTAPK